MIRSIIKTGLTRLGYRLVRVSEQRVPIDPDSKAANELSPSECYGVFKSACPIFEPWLGYGDFAAAFDGVNNKTLVSADRCYLLWRLARHSRQLKGDFIECGVYRGGTGLLLARSMSAKQSLWLFDSFEGLSEASQEKGDIYRRGDFNDTSFEAVSKLFDPFPHKTKIVKGWIPASFSGLDYLRFSFAHVDVDLYQPALACCEFIFPRLVSGAVIVFDDYGYPACRGERNAVDEYFKGRSEPIIVLPSGQAIVIKV